MPLKSHPTDPDKMVYASRQYDIPQLQGVTTTQRPWVGLTDEERDRFVYIDAKDKKRFRKYGAEIEQLLKEKNAQE